MRRCDLVSVLFVGVVAFGWAVASKHGPGLDHIPVPSWVPGLGDPLVDWEPDLVVRQGELRVVRGEVARARTVWEPPQKPDIVVIVLDTVRADRMGLYGYGRGTTPRIDAWAEGARVYDQMQSNGA